MALIQHAASWVPIQSNNNYYKYIASIIIINTVQDFFEQFHNDNSSSYYTFYPITIKYKYAEKTVKKIIV